MVAIIEIPFKNIHIHEYAGNLAFSALSMSTSAVAGQFCMRQLAATLPVDYSKAGW